MDVISRCKVHNGSQARGFTLLELSLVLMIIAIITSMAIMSGISVVANARQSATERKMKIIEQALMQYRVAHDRLPCPADLTLAPGNADYGLEAGADASSSITTGTGACTGSGMKPEANFTGAGATNTWQTGAEGSLPAVTLGLSPDFMLDGWGHKFRYAVDESMTANGAFSTSSYAPLGCNAGAITIDDANGTARSTSAIYALISQGANGHGAYTAAGSVVNAGSVNANELINCHCTSAGVAGTYSPTYVQAAYSVDPANALDSFDDLVAYKERWQMQTSWDRPGWCNYVYVADYNNGLVQVFDLKGDFLWQFNNNVGNPAGLYFDADDNLWVADDGSWIKKFSESGIYQNFTFGSYGTGNGQFESASRLAIDARGNFWISESRSNRVEEMSRNGTYIGQLGCSSGACTAGTANGQFHDPASVVIDPNQNIWVADSQNNRIQEFSSNGTWLASLGGTPEPCSSCLCVSSSCPTTSGSGNGQFTRVYHFTIDAEGNIWAIDNNNERVEEFDKYGNFLSQFNIEASGIRIWGPAAIAIDPNGNIWITNNGTCGGGGSAVGEYSPSGAVLAKIAGCGSGNGTLGDQVLGVSVSGER